MKRMLSPSPRGYTLVELVVGLVLTVFVVAMIITYLMGAARIFSVQTNEALIQDNARFALDRIARFIRMAGSNPNNSVVYDVSPIYSKARCSAEANRSNAANEVSLCTQDELSKGSGRLAIAYVLNSPGFACDGSEILAQSNQPVRIATLLWTADIDGDGIRSLYCQTHTIDSNAFIGRATPLVEGVEAFQFQFGLDTNYDGVIDQYQNQSNRVSTLESAKIKAVRFAILVATGSAVQRDRVLDDHRYREYRLLGAGPVTINDSLLRSVYSSTIMLPSAG